jgi:hypothetical protein
MVVMLGAHNVREASEEGRLELTTTDFFTHPDYNTFNLHNDLALVHLPQPVNFTDIIRPICLPGHSEAGTAWAGEAAIASGWGKPSDASDSISPELRCGHSVASAPSSDGWTLTQSPTPPASLSSRVSSTRTSFASLEPMENPPAM